MTFKQYEKWLESKRGWAEDIGLPDLPAVGDASQTYARNIALELEGPEIIACLRKRGVTDIEGRLTDDLYSVAVSENWQPEVQPQKGRRRR